MNSLIEQIKLRPIKNLNLSGFYGNYGFQNSEKINNSYLCRGKSDQPWVFFLVADRQDFSGLLSLLTPADKYYFAIENWMIPYFEELKNIDWLFSTLQYYLPQNMPVEKPRQETINLTPDYSSYIFSNSNYKDFLSVDFISERIEKGISSGIVIENQLAAWAITHDDGAIGFLHVLEKFRRRGLAKNIMFDMINKVRNQGNIPFVYVEESNSESTSLVKKLGFQLDKEISWIKLK